MNKAVIFCQAPIEVPNVISIYDKICNSYQEITIISLRTDSYKSFFESINIKAELKFWQAININIFSFFNILNIRRKLKSQILSIDVNKSDFFFTSRFDFQLSCYLGYLPYNSKKIYFKGKDSIWITDKKFKTNIKNYIKFILMRSISKCPLKYFKTGDYKFLPEINVDKVRNIVLEHYIEDKSILKKYLYIPKSKNNNKVILFTEPYRNKYQTENDYNSVNKKVVEILRNKGYYVVMKGHPRIGNHPLLLDIVDETIPSYISSEFIDMNSFVFAIGFVSTSLCDSSNYIPSYSVLDLCEIVDNSDYNYWHNFIDRVGEKRVIYFKSFNELKSL